MTFRVETTETSEQDVHCILSKRDGDSLVVRIDDHYQEHSKSFTQDNL